MGESCWMKLFIFHCSIRVHWNSFKILQCNVFCFSLQCLRILCEVVKTCTIALINTDMIQLEDEAPVGQTFLEFLADYSTVFKSLTVAASTDSQSVHRFSFHSSQFDFRVVVVHIASCLHVAADNGRFFVQRRELGSVF